METPSDERSPPIDSIQYLPKQQGESDGEPLLGKCCFFLRNAPPGQPLDVTKEGEAVRPCRD
jgi:hypothetical protein